MKSEKAPIISVVIACYNQGIYLSDALNSLEKQTFQNWEGIIVNDGSTDGTEEIALEYVKKDERFKYVFQENGGVSKARNIGAAQALGTYILPLDADDKLEETYIEKALSHFTHHPETLLVYCQWGFFGEATNHSQVSYKGYAKLLVNNEIFCSSVFRKSDMLRIGGFDEDMHLGLEDWEFYIRLLDEQSIVYQIQEPLFFYRIKAISKNVTAAQNIAEVENYIYQKHIRRYSLYYGSAILPLRRLFLCEKELEDCKARIARHKNKWYRRLFYKYIKGNLKKK